MSGAREQTIGGEKQDGQGRPGRPCAHTETTNIGSQLRIAMTATNPTKARGDAMRSDPRGTPFHRRVPRRELGELVDPCFEERRARQRAIRDSSRLLLLLREAHPEGGNRDMMLRPKKIALPADGKRKNRGGVMTKRKRDYKRDLLLAAIRII